MTDHIPGATKKVDDPLKRHNNTPWHSGNSPHNDQAIYDNANENIGWIEDDDLREHAIDCVNACAALANQQAQVERLVEAAGEAAGQIRSENKRYQEEHDCVFGPNDNETLVELENTLADMKGKTDGKD